jgi:hypothetical protein
MDASDLTDHESMEPCYVQPMCLDAQTLITSKGIQLCGFCPETVQDDRVLQSILLEHCDIVGAGKLNEACTVNRQWMGQDYFWRKSER